MADDQQLSKNFWLREFPGWERATDLNVAKAQETVARVLQPIRNQFGAVQVSSWIWWSDGSRRTGSHGQGGTVDFYVGAGLTEEAWKWGNTHLMPAGYIGRWIYEPQTPNQGEHIHMAPRADMVKAFGDGRIQSLRKLPSGDTFVFQEWAEGTYGNPYQLPGFVATARAGIPWWLSLGVLFAIVTADFSGQAHGGWLAGRT